MHKQTILLILSMIASGILGYYANIWANRSNNALLVQMIKDQLGCVNSQIANNATTNTSRQDMDYLLQRRAYLQQQLDYYSKKFGIYA